MTGLETVVKALRLISTMAIIPGLGVAIWQLFLVDKSIQVAALATSQNSYYQARTNVIEVDQPRTQELALLSLVYLSTIAHSSDDNYNDEAHRAYVASVKELNDKNCVVRDDNWARFYSVAREVCRLHQNDILGSLAEEFITSVNKDLEILKWTSCAEILDAQEPQMPKCRELKALDPQ